MADVLGQLSKDLADLVKNNDASIVRIEARRRLPATGLVWSADGLIVTADHVIDRRADPNKIGVGLAGGKSATAQLVGRDPSTDIAVLRVDAQLTAPQWGNSDDLSVGNLVLAVGRPGADVMATLGVVSAIAEGWQTRGGGKIDRYLQTDVLMYPGFSGGALLSADSRLFGMNTSALGRGVSLTIPTETLQRVVEMLVAHGRVKRGYLGVGVQDVQLPTALAQAKGQASGVLLISVESDSPAEAVGLSLGDTLIALDGQPVRSVEELLGLLVGERVGQAVKVVFVRGGEVQEKTVTIAEREESPEDHQHGEHGKRGRGGGWGRRGGR